MKAGLIGHTGFVGGTLARATEWDTSYNSTNIAEIRGSHFDLLVCAGVSAIKWAANGNPGADRAAIGKLTDQLATVTARELVLISTIDVYPEPAEGGDEDSLIDPDANHAYGRHRRELEQWAAERFEVTRIIRLPALFGKGLRKNALYDLLNDNMVASINPASRFQWYPLDRLWSDIALARRHALPVLNLFAEPVTMSHLVERLFPGAPVGPARRPAPTYDMQTRYGELFGGNRRYLMPATATIEAIANFVEAERTR